MHIRSLIFSILALCATTIAAQTTFVDGNTVVAHGVDAHGSMPPALESIMRGRNIKQREDFASTHTTRHAKALPTNTIGPLLKSIRDQDEPYNWMCPRWRYDDGTESESRCLSGCVATSIEQLMAYYRYPEALVDTLFGWVTPNYELPDMLPGTRFDWDNLLNDYRQGYSVAEGEAVALTSLAAGMAVYMRYGLKSSGASIWEAPAQLRRALGYGMARVYDRALYTPSRWHDILYEELSHGRPVAYTGHNVSLSGHAFNIDGVDSQGFYHVNWGYDGRYDGWYDLDWLNPWEPTDMPANGYQAGFFANNTMLVMHPSAEVQPLQPDTLRLDSTGVKLLNIKLLRPADVRGYIPADFFFENTSNDTVPYTYEVMSFLRSDTAVFMQSDYVGIATVTLLPHERRTQRLYLRFHEVGHRLLGISNDDVTIPYFQPVKVTYGTPSQLEWGEAEVTLDADSVVLTVPVSNLAKGDFAGDLVTFCLHLDTPDSQDSRHYEVLNLPAGQSTVLRTCFRGLTPATGYRLLVRCPWSVVAEKTFTTSGGADDIMGIEQTDQAPQAPNSLDSQAYDLAGRPISTNSHNASHIVVQGRHKFAR